VKQCRALHATPRTRRDRDANPRPKHPPGALPSIWSSAPGMTLDTTTARNRISALSYRYSPHPTENVGISLIKSFAAPPTLPPRRVEPVLFPTANSRTPSRCSAPFHVSPPPEKRSCHRREVCLLAQTGVGEPRCVPPGLCRLWRPTVLAASRLVGNTGEAEELLQDAFL